MTPLDEKTTPLKLNEAASSKSDKKVYWKYNKDDLSDHKKAIPLEVAHMDIYKYKDILKLDEAYLRLLRLKRLSRIRHARCKVWVCEYGLVLDIQENVQMHDYGLILDKKDSIKYTNVLEDEALTPEDSLTRLYALEEVRGLDQEVKRYGLYSNE